LDETALFYKLLPSSTLASERQKGVKADKKRITIAYFVNATGTNL
jgi:hypothetical protein